MTYIASYSGLRANYSLGDDNLPPRVAHFSAKAEVKANRAKRALARVAMRDAAKAIARETKAQDKAKNKGRKSRT